MLLDRQERAMPMTPLSAQVERYSRDGIVSPMAALARAEAAESRGKLEAVHGLIRRPAILDGDR
jgi:hypothetical protein